MAGPHRGSKADRWHSPHHRESRRCSPANCLARVTLTISIVGHHELGHQWWFLSHAFRWVVHMTLPLGIGWRPGLAHARPSTNASHCP